MDIVDRFKPRVAAVANDASHTGMAEIFSIEVPIGRAASLRPLAAGAKLVMPEHVNALLGIAAFSQFTLTHSRHFAFGTMGFCQCDARPSVGIWIRLAATPGAQRTDRSGNSPG